jgi:ABC-type Fe3+-citrate transport system substrate-binding protein
MFKVINKKKEERKTLAEDENQYSSVKMKTIFNDRKHTKTTILMSNRNNMLFAKQTLYHATSFV